MWNHWGKKYFLLNFQYPRILYYISGLRKSKEIIFPLLPISEGKHFLSNLKLAKSTKQANTYWKNLIPLNVKDFKTYTTFLKSQKSH